MTTQPPDYLQLFTGLPLARVLELLQGLLSKREPLEMRIVDLMTTNPMEATTGFLVGSSLAFYLAERGVNPRVNTFIDALYYISTCLAVGYADIFPVTQRGKAVATLAMLVGPALTAEFLDAPHRAAGASEVGQGHVIERLDAILEELRGQAV
ncbi:MAG: two pore domain potassium channel family protein [Ardenticatenales bacterium]|nr:two pore domain potassium channel family protein [Ardenticatenales bacterium]